MCVTYWYYSGIYGCITVICGVTNSVDLFNCQKCGAIRAKYPMNNIYTAVCPGRRTEAFNSCMCDFVKGNYVKRM